MPRRPTELAALLATVLSPLAANAALTLSPDSTTVYDSANNINWLADANLAATEQFGIPVCNSTRIQPCVNADGSMNYASAQAWLQAMNAANYLGHSNWQFPTTPTTDNGCGKVGPQGNSFGFGCTAGALGSLYYNGLGLKAPNTAVAVPGNTVGPFSNFQPYLYWYGSPGMGGNATLSFNTGFQGANTVDNFLYLLPMIPGKIAGTPAATGTGLQVNPGGQTIYDPVSNVTWLANANLAASNAFGLPYCTTPTAPATCVDQDGAMTIASATQFLANMNSYNGSGYLGQNRWQLPVTDVSCTGYGCSENNDPMAELFYNQLGLGEGISVVAAPGTGVGPFIHVQPYLYWTCGGATIQSACSTPPATNFEWTFSFGDGFLGTDILSNEFYVMPYYVGAASTASGPQISFVANAEGENPVISPNTWVLIRGVNLGPAGDLRTWQLPDFGGGGTLMPLALDGVTVTVNGKSAYVEYISPTQINILTPPDAMSGAVQVQVNNNGKTTPLFTAQAQPLSPSFFAFNGGPYLAARHLNGSILAPASLYPGFSTPAVPGEIIEIYANGFGPTSGTITPGLVTQSGTLPANQPVIMVGTKTAAVGYNGLGLAGEFQFNVTLPLDLPNGDLPISATYNGLTTQAGTLLTIQRLASQ